MIRTFKSVTVETFSIMFSWWKISSVYLFCSMVPRVWRWMLMVHCHILSLYKTTVVVIHAYICILHFIFSQSGVSPSSTSPNVLYKLVVLLSLGIKLNDTLFRSLLILKRSNSCGYFMSRKFKKFVEHLDSLIKFR